MAHQILQHRYGVRVTDQDFVDRVSMDCNADALRALQERVGRQWRFLGEQEPYWSVITAPQFRRAALDDSHVVSFYASGEEHAEQLDRMIARFGITLPAKSVIDFGCGVGRISLHLLQRGYQTTGVDISPGNLAIAKDKLARFGDAFVPVLIQDPSDIDNLSHAAAVISFITLQHNAPPIQALILRKLFAKLADGGVALFQVPTFKPDYGFDASLFASGANMDPMDMHCLPMSRVLQILHESGMRPLDILQDAHTGADYQSHTIFAVKG